MRKQKSTMGLKIAILGISLIQMGTNASSTILTSIAEKFPAASIAQIQFLMTFPNLMILLSSIAMISLSRKFSLRLLAATGMALCGVSGLLAFLLHGSLLLLYVWAGMFGCGIGIVVPIGTALIADQFSGKEKDNMLGYQSGAANVGSMLMTYVGGLLASAAWFHMYLVYMLAFAGLIPVLRYVPGKLAGAPSTTAGKLELPRFAWKYFGLVFIYMQLFFVCPTNLGLLIQERRLGAAQEVGTAMTVLLISGAVVGVLFGYFAKKLGKNTVIAGLGLLSTGCFLIYSGRHLNMMFLGSLFAGASISLVMPQCMGRLAAAGSQQSMRLMSMAFALSNLGIFIAPIFTRFTSLIMGSGLAEERFLLAGIVTILIAALFKLTPESLS